MLEQGEPGGRWRGGSRRVFRPCRPWEWVSFVLKVLQQQMEKGRDIGKRVEEEVPAPFPHRHTGLAVTYR